MTDGYCGGTIRITGGRPLDISLSVPKAGPFLDWCLVSVDDLLGRGYNIVPQFAIGSANDQAPQHLELLFDMPGIINASCSAFPRYVQDYTPGTNELHPNV